MERELCVQDLDESPLHHELTWGRSYRTLKQTNKNSTIKQKHSPINVPFKLCRMLQKPRKSKKISCNCPKTSCQYQPPISLLGRTALSQDRYMSLLAIPQNPPKIVKPRKKRICCKCELEPCSPRLIQMAVPNKRIVLQNWKDYQFSLPPEILTRFDQILKSGGNLEPKDARYYFKQLKRKELKLKRKQRRICRKKRKLLRRSERMWLKNQIEETADAIVNYMRSEPLLMLNFQQMITSNELLNYLNTQKVIKIKTRNTKCVYKKTIIEISDKLVKWMDTVNFFADIQPVSSKEKILEIPSLESLLEEEIEEEEESEEERLKEEERIEGLEGEETGWERELEAEGVAGGDAGLEEFMAKKIVDKAKVFVEEDEEGGSIFEALKDLDEDVLDKLIQILSSSPNDFLTEFVDETNLPGVTYGDVLQKLQEIRDGNLIDKIKSKIPLEERMVEWAMHNDPTRVDEKILHKIHETSTILVDWFKEVDISELKGKKREEDEGPQEVVEEVFGKKEDMGGELGAAPPAAEEKIVGGAEAAEGIGEEDMDKTLVAAEEGGQEGGMDETLVAATGGEGEEAPAEGEGAEAPVEGEGAEAPVEDEGAEAPTEGEAAEAPIEGGGMETLAEGEGVEVPSEGEVMAATAEGESVEVSAEVTEAVAEGAEAAPGGVEAPVEGAEAAAEEIEPPVEGAEAAAEEVEAVAEEVEAVAEGVEAPVEGEGLVEGEAKGEEGEGEEELAFLEGEEAEEMFEASEEMLEAAEELLGVAEEMLEAAEEEFVEGMEDFEVAEGLEEEFEALAAEELAEIEGEAVGLAEEAAAVPVGLEEEELITKVTSDFEKLDSLLEIIRAHKPTAVFQHQPGTICCLSLKVWAVWLLKIANNAHNWTKWIEEIIKQVRYYASVIRGDVLLPNGQKKVLYKEEWRCFVKETEEKVVAWRQYSKHVKDLSTEIMETFHGKQVTCCAKCLQDHLIKNVVTAHETFQSLTEAINCAGYWQRCLDKIVEQTSKITEVDAAREEPDLTSMESQESYTIEIEELPRMPPCTVLSEDSDDSLYEIEEITSFYGSKGTPEFHIIEEIGGTDKIKLAKKGKGKGKGKTKGKAKKTKK